MSQEDPYIPPFVRRAMNGATEDELVQATDNLRQYLRVMYKLFRELEAASASGDSSEFDSNGRFEMGTDRSPQQ